MKIPKYVEKAIKDYNKYKFLSDKVEKTMLEFLAKNNMLYRDYYLHINGQYHQDMADFCFNPVDDHTEAEAMIKALERHDNKILLKDQPIKELYILEEWEI